MRIHFCFSLLFFLIISNCCAFATDFIDGFEDIPLMSGFRQIPTQDFSFSNEETGYIETTLISQKRLPFSSIKTFYADSLSALGWKLKDARTDELIFYRDNDILEITQMQKQPLKLIISLKSKN